ncbi:hypothetical protein BDW72DRAFT_190653 [Aspergillus terricola var. indicus]
MTTLKDQIAVEAIDKNCYRSVLPPFAWAISPTGLTAATSPLLQCRPPMRLSLQASTSRPRHADLPDTTTSRSPVRREIRKLCLIATADFHIDEADEMVNYSARPQLPVPTSPAAETETENTPEPGLYRILNMMMEVRPHQGGRNGKDIWDIVSAERFRVHEAFHTEADRIAALAFYMDRGLAYIPANHSGYSLSQASACATLDFALRVLTHHNARALGEGRVFNRDGRLLASMTQATILRPKKVVSRI